MDTRWHTADSFSFDDFVATVSVETDEGRYPHADRVDQGVVVFDAAALIDAASQNGRAIALELADALRAGPGVLVIEAAVDVAAIDAASAVFFDIIEEQKRSETTAGDHFAKPGANDRIWNAQEKLCVAAPEVFANYFAAPLIDMVAAAWLGPAYQVTSQVNVVNPGGEAQEPHRDYHLGFMTNAEAERFPPHVHGLSPLLTLQGAVAHIDMPVETGPTLYLPHSQKFPAGYLAWRDDRCRAWFAEHHVQLPLAKGDLVFFNPALFHAAGHNRTADVHRMGNLLQISSAFGRAMETVDRAAMSLALLPVLQRRHGEGVDHAALRRIIAASAEGYPFPTSLDEKQPTDGLTPPTMADRLVAAVVDGASVGELAAQLGVGS